MFSRSAAFYDAIYSFKDYAAESAKVLQIIQEQTPAAKSLLDVACGTGAHLRHLKSHLQCAGTDVEEGLLEIAQQQNPEVEFYEADMREFDLGRRFDVITCLFSAIGYAETLDGLSSTAACFAKHLNPGGLAIVEPWLEPSGFQDGHIGLTTVDQPELKIARMNTSRREGNVSILQFEYLIATPEGMERMSEEHRLGLFTRQEHQRAFEQAGFTTEYDPKGLMGRGLYILRNAT